MTPIKSGVYWIRNKINNHIYIGSSANMYWRKHKHSLDLNRMAHHNYHLQNAFNKYGIKNFSFKVLITCHPDMLLWYEQQFIDQWHPEYNICPIAGNRMGCKLSEETKRKMSLHCGHKHSLETRKKMSKSHIGRKHPHLVHKHSEETKRKMSISQIGNKNFLGHTHSKETKRKSSERMKIWWELRRVNESTH